MKKEKKKYGWQAKGIMITFALVVALLIAESYAWMLISRSSTTVNKITAGSLDLILDESSSEGILLQNTVPMSFQQGIETTAYTFKLKNNSQTPADYTISLEDYYDDVTVPTEGKIADSKIRYILLKDDETAQATNSKLLSTGREIETGTIQGSTETSYTLYVWIDSTAGTEVNNQIFNGRLNITAEQAANTVPTTTGNNILVAYTYDYDATNNPTGCITGEEATCQETTCYETKTAGSCPAGTIIKYKVNASEEKYFHVLHDDGNTITMQQRENTTDNVAWYSTSNDNSHGPTTALSVLENATAGWSNVNDQTYTLGTTTLYQNAYTGCTGSSGNALSCSTNIYTLGQRTAKARMIIGQETAALGCKYGKDGSCSNWLNNYLYDSTSYGGGTVNSTTDSKGSNTYGYWTMSAYSSNSNFAWGVYYAGYEDYGNTTNTNRGTRAVVEINK